ncbi:MAG: DMT family transporter [Candidatus Cloacimonas sp.]|jgi:drug/metabolite transporter (DMT)-like permease|nr:DMT family transporter [Candidatus Cloacimonas sp.]
MKLTKQQIAYLYASASILAWSSISTAFKLSLSQLSSFGLLFIASFSAVLFLGVANLLRNANAQYSLKTFIKNVRLSMLPGMLNPFVYYLILFEAYNRLRAQEAQALNYTWAIVLALFSIWLLKEKFRVLDLLALLISFLGVVIISARGNLTALHFDDAIGSFMAVFTSLIWAFYWIINLKDKRPALVKLFFNFLIGFLLIAAYVLIGRAKVFLPGANLLYGLIGGIYVGIFEMGLTFLLWFKALEYTDNTAKISNLIFLTPFISLLFIAQILGESIHPATFVGLCLIVLSNLIQKGLFHFSKRNT